MKSGKSTLAAWLHRLDAAHLEEVLAARPDIVSPPEPRSVNELAERLQRPGSVALALPWLTLPALQAAEALAALTSPVSRETLADLLDATEGEAARGLQAALQSLATCAGLAGRRGSTADGRAPAAGVGHTARTGPAAGDAAEGHDL